jgi:hypothetical protein
VGWSEKYDDWFPVTSTRVSRYKSFARDGTNWNKKQSLGGWYDNDVVIDYAD